MVPGGYVSDLDSRCLVLEACDGASLQLAAVRLSERGVPDTMSVWDATVFYIVVCCRDIPLVLLLALKPTARKMQQEQSTGR